MVQEGFLELGRPGLGTWIFFLIKRPSCNVPDQSFIAFSSACLHETANTGPNLVYTCEWDLPVSQAEFLIGAQTRRPTENSQNALETSDDFQTRGAGWGGISKLLRYSGSSPLQYFCCCSYQKGVNLKSKSVSISNCLCLFTDKGGIICNKSFRN